MNRPIAFLPTAPDFLLKYSIRSQLLLLSRLPGAVIDSCVCSGDFGLLGTLKINFTPGFDQVTSEPTERIFNGGES